MPPLGAHLDPASSVKPDHTLVVLGTNVAGDHWVKLREVIELLVTFAASTMC
jgi:hypothetical protein